MHVHFYNAEAAILQEWWFPIGVIRRPSVKHGSIKAVRGYSSFEKQAADGFVDQAAICFIPQP